MEDNLFWEVWEKKYEDKFKNASIKKYTEDLLKKYYIISYYHRKKIIHENIKKEFKNAKDITLLVNVKFLP